MNIDRRLVQSVFTALALLLLAGFGQNSTAQQLVNVDEQGVLRYSQTQEEAAFFGVNYSPPFAHSFRAINRLGKNHKKVIDQDAYHFARLGFDGFRIHVWDTEISDSLGHLVNNEHLDLLDYMLAKFKQRGIKVILTPITFYDNGYPEPPTETNGFANYISKEEAPQNPEYWPVIKRFLNEFLHHKNPYTGLTYREDPNIIATEIINEPSHGGDQDSLTEYINMLADHIRENGWEKPIFYNIAQNPPMADGVMNADIDGTSFQWYPGGLVGGEAIPKNYLPYIDEYRIPFRDEEAFQSKAQMVYEFDSADFLGSYAYPAMARSFREAGFQWATQFAYDPMAMGHVNTDYRTHYLNMAYTPSKAVSMKIASAAFHRLPRNGDFGRYPQNNTFGDFRVSHQEDLSELNADTAFFYSNDTDAEPVNPSALKHVAGVGNSAVVSYEGTGAYFMDKVQDGVWRLEVMPDVAHIKDPFATVALDKRLTWIDWNEHQMSINLPNLGDAFQVQGVNSNNDRMEATSNGAFTISPGSYLLYRDDRSDELPAVDQQMDNYRINEFVAPPATETKTVVRHDPAHSAPANQPLEITATIAELRPRDSVNVLVQSGWQPQSIPMEQVGANSYQAEIPGENVNPGMLTYWITVDRGEQTITFPGGHEGHPGQWDYYHTQQWQVRVAGQDTPITLFDARDDANDIDVAFSFWNSDSEMSVRPTSEAGETGISVSSPELLKMYSGQALGWKTYVGDAMALRGKAVDQTDQLVVKARGIRESSTIKAIVVQKDGSSFSAEFEASDQYQNYTISFSAFRPDSMMLLPRPYPTFLPLWFTADTNNKLDPSAIEEIQFLLTAEDNKSSDDGDSGFEISKVWIDKRNN